MVEYLGWETTYTEIVDSVRLRPKSVEPPITVHTFFTFKVVLPEEIKNFYSYLPEEKHADLHNDFKNAIHAAKVEFIKDEDFLKVLSLMKGQRDTTYNNYDILCLGEYRKPLN